MNELIPDPARGGDILPWAQGVTNVCRRFGGVGTGRMLVREGPGVSRLIRNGAEGEFMPKFREAPYTPLKKVVDRPGREFDVMKKGIDRAAAAARAKKDRVLAKLQ